MAYTACISYAMPGIPPLLNRGVSDPAFDGSQGIRFLVTRQNCLSFMTFLQDWSGSLFSEYLEWNFSVGAVSKYPQNTLVHIFAVFEKQKMSSSQVRQMIITGSTDTGRLDYHFADMSNRTSKKVLGSKYNIVTQSSHIESTTPCQNHVLPRF